MLRVLNRGLGANFSLPRFQNVAAWNDEEHWIEMRLQAKERHVVDLGVLDIDVEFAKDEVICQWPRSSPRRRPVVLPAGGHGFSPVAASCFSPPAF